MQISKSNVEIAEMNFEYLLDASLSYVHWMSNAGDIEKPEDIRNDFASAALDIKKRIIGDLRRYIVHQLEKSVQDVRNSILKCISANANDKHRSKPSYYSESAETALISITESVLREEFIKHPTRRKIEKNLVPIVIYGLMVLGFITLAYNDLFLKPREIKECISFGNSRSDCEEYYD
jgi:hypothetical protein